MALCEIGTMNWDTATSVASVLQAAVVIGAAAFAAYEYYIVRRLRPRIQFDVDFEVHRTSEQDRRYILVAKLEMTNTGSVRKFLPEIDLQVTTSSATDIEAAANRPQRLKFSRTLVCSHNIVRDPMDPWWIDPGVKHVFRHPVVIGEPGQFVCLDARFFYYKPPRKRAQLYRRHEELRERQDAAAPAAKNLFEKDQVDYHQACRIKEVL